MKDGDKKATRLELLLAERKANKESHKCSWIVDNDGVWWTACQNAFILEVETPSHNKMKYCCYCGRPLTDQTNNQKVREFLERLNERKNRRKNL